MKDLIKKYHDEIVTMRRHLHANPELSLHEKETSNYIIQVLDDLNIPFVRVGDFGIVATIEGNRTDRMIALRADMDALPIVEENDHLDYQSKNKGVMHACGHDGHVAMMLGAAKMFLDRKDQLNGTVKLCFQQAEEVGKGTQEILAELEKYPIESVFGIHLWSEIPTGLISVESGPRMAAGEGIKITLHGKGCHGANPDKGVDPIQISAAIIMNLSAMMTREINPLHGSIITFGKISGGTMRNVIPENVVLEGTIRNTNEETRLYMREAVTRIVESTASMYKGSATIEWIGGVPLIDNAQSHSEIAIEAVKKIAGENSLTLYDTLMASENFAEFQVKYPGVFAFVGVRNDECGANYPHHHPKFNIDEAPLSTGAGLHVQYAIDFFNR